MRVDHKGSYSDERAADAKRKWLKEFLEKIVRSGGSARGSERIAQTAAIVVPLDQFLWENFPDRQRSADVVCRAMNGLDFKAEGHGIYWSRLERKDATYGRAPSRNGGPGSGASAVSGYGVDEDTLRASTLPRRTLTSAP